ncbi:MAG TPA: hypothetical protein DHU33_06110 [Firmicutes bacterium]|nr:hypothetical protein [Bacillota bacterium]
MKYTEEQLNLLKENGIKSLVLEHQRDQKLQNAVIPFDPEIFEDLANLIMNKDINETLYAKYDEFLATYGIVLPEDATEEDKNNYETKIQLFVMGLQAQINKETELYEAAIHYTADEIKAMDTPDKDKLLEIKKNIAPFETIMPAKEPTEEYKKEVQGYIDLYNEVYSDSKPSFSADYSFGQLLDILLSPKSNLSKEDVVIKEYIESKIGSTENFNDLTRDEQDDYLRKAIYVAAGMLDAKDGKNYADTYKDYFYYMDDYKYNEAESAKVSLLYEAMSKMEAVRNEGMSENYVSSIILSGIDTGEKHKFIDNKTYQHIIETPLSKLEEEKNPENIAIKNTIIAKYPEPKDESKYAAYAKKVLKTMDYSDEEILEDEEDITSKMVSQDYIKLEELVHNTAVQRFENEQNIERCNQSIALLNRVINEKYVLTDEEKISLNIEPATEITEELAKQKLADLETELAKLKELQTSYNKKYNTYNTAKIDIKDNYSDILNVDYSKSILGRLGELKDKTADNFKNAAGSIKENAYFALETLKLKGVKAKEKVAAGIEKGKEVAKKGAKIIKKGAFKVKDWVDKHVAKKVQKIVRDVTPDKIAALVIGGAIGISVSLAFGHVGVMVMDLGIVLAKSKIKNQIIANQELEIKRLKGEIEAENIEQPTNALLAKIKNSKVGQYFQSEEGLKALSWGLNAALIAGTATEIGKTIYSARVAPKTTNSVTSTPKAEAPAPEPQVTTQPATPTPEAVTQAPTPATPNYEGIKLGNQVGNYNVSHGYDTASYAVNNINRESLISNIVTKDSVFKRFAILNQDGTVAQIINTPGTSLADLASQYGAENIAVDVANSSGVSQAWTTAADLISTVGKGL